MLGPLNLPRQDFTETAGEHRAVLLQEQALTLPHGTMSELELSEQAYKVGCAVADKCNSLNELCTL